MVCVTTIVLGGLMPKCIKYFLGDGNSASVLEVEGENEEPAVPKEEKKEKKGLAGFYQNKFKPFFIF